MWTCILFSLAKTLYHFELVFCFCFIILQVLCLHSNIPTCQAIELVYLLNACNRCPHSRMYKCFFFFMMTFCYIFLFWLSLLPLLFDSISDAALFLVVSLSYCWCCWLLCFPAVFALNGVLLVCFQLTCFSSSFFSNNQVYVNVYGDLCNFIITFFITNTKTSMFKRTWALSKINIGIF